MQELQEKQYQVSLLSSMYFLWSRDNVIQFIWLANLQDWHVTFLEWVENFLEHTEHSSIVTDEKWFLTQFFSENINTGATW